jgi:hypothetical protein
MFIYSIIFQNCRCPKSHRVQTVECSSAPRPPRPTHPIDPGPLSIKLYLSNIKASLDKCLQYSIDWKLYSCQAPDMLYLSSWLLKLLIIEYLLFYHSIRNNSVATLMSFRVKITIFCYHPTHKMIVASSEFGLRTKSFNQRFLPASEALRVYFLLCCCCCCCCCCC